MFGFIRKYAKALRWRRKYEKFSRKSDGYLALPSVTAQESPAAFAPGKPRSIAFLIPGMQARSGGHTSILRLGTHLANFGHDVAYIRTAKADVPEMEAAARANLPGFKGRFYDASALGVQSFDVGVATKWTTCSDLLHHRERFGLAMYFIQDFEPFFHGIGDEYLLALHTYKLGLRMVSLGGWNARMIRAFLGREAHAVDFPVELSEYPLVPRNISLGGTVRFAVYLRNESKRAPFLLLEQLRHVKAGLEERGGGAEIAFFGLDKTFRPPFGENLGMLSPSELRALYLRSDFGVVASLTNISLVNYEMIASGLPVIDFADGSAPDYFAPDEMLFIESHPLSMRDRVLASLDDQVGLNSLLQRGQRKIAGLSWEKSARQFERIIEGACRNQAEASRPAGPE